MNRFREIRSRLAALAVGIFLALALGELALRVVDLGPISRVPQPNHVDPDLVLHQIDPDPEIGWTLRPGARGSLGVPVRVNQLGCRGPEPLPGQTLLLSIGDSIAFGAGVLEDELFASRLEARLRQSGCDALVLACGVSGYNLLQTTRRYDRDLAPARPAVVLLSLFSDDLAPPYRMVDRTFAAWARPRSALFRAVDFAWTWTSAGGAGWLPAWAEAPRAHRDRTVAAFPGWAGRLHGEGALLLTLQHPMLHRAGDNPGGNTSPDLPWLAELAQAPTLRAEDAYREAVGVDLPALSILPASSDPHPNSRGQAILADAIWVHWAPQLRAACTAP